MKRCLIISIIFVSALILAFTFLNTGCNLMETMSAEELKASIEIVDVQTKWVLKYYQPWPPKLILVPAISFRVKNVTEKSLRYINFIANFRFKDDYENLGDCYLAAIRKEPVRPGELSKVITLKSNYGVEGKSLNTFKDNPAWKITVVNLFAQSKGSQPVKLGQWEISRKIDFKEPEPVGMEKKEKK